jgi:crotonobetainyl-CoA:carnitine CoA-transferase CaiB-like acyl-CoA transferase
MAISPYNVYETTDGYLASICITDRHWERFVRLTGNEELLDDERFSSKVNRAAHIPEVDAIVEEWLEGKTKDEAAEILLENKIPTAPVQTTEEIVEDPQLLHREMINYIENKGAGRDEIPVPGMPSKFPRNDPADITPSPRVGEDTTDVLQELAGYSPEEIEALRAKNVF